MIGAMASIVYTKGIIMKKNLDMALTIIVRGTGIVGRAAMRKVLSQRDLDLVTVTIASNKKVGLDAGQIAGAGQFANG